MSLNSTVIADKARKSLGQFISTEAHTDTNIVRYINTCIRTICEQYNFDFNKYIQSVVTDGITLDYTIPTVIQIYTLFASNGDEIDVKQFEDYYSDFVPTGVCIKEDQFITSDADTFRLIYRGYPESIAALGDLIPIPDYFEEALLYYCIKEGFREVKNFERMGIYTGQFDRVMIRLSATQENVKPLKTTRTFQHTF